MEIRALRADDDRTAFRSGVADLDRYLHQFAGQNQFRHHLGVTYVAVEDRAILGFATVAAAHIEIDDLPLEGLTSLRARFDLMGAGEVWVDDVQVFGLAFSKPELVELSKLITLADVKLQNGQLGDCLRLLEGYWPRFLEENVALPAGAVPLDTATAKPNPSEETPPERSGLLNRMKDMLPESLRF